MRSVRHFLRRALGWPGFVVIAVALGILLVSPSIGGGLVSDDHIQRMWVKKSGRCLELFTFLAGDEAVMRGQQSGGTMPWYSDWRLKISFFRPLASLSHCIDYRYLDSFPALLHLENLLWFGAAIGAAFALFRAVGSAPWITGLATLFFAIAETHGPAVAWLANRNTLMATTFGALTLTLYHRARSQGSRWQRWLGPFVFLLALLSAEAALSVVAYLIAHALFLDRDTKLGRLRALVPYLVTLVAWRIAYTALGYGQYGSALYTDPLGSPMRFLAAVVERAPFLLFAQLGGVSADLVSHLGMAERKVAWLVAAGFLLGMAILLVPLLRRRPEARFFALGMVLSVIPACATLPRDRLLMLTSLGAMGLIAESIGPLLDKVSELPKRSFSRLSSYVLATLFIGIHGIFAVVRLPINTLFVKGAGDWFDSASESLFADIEPRSAVIALYADNMFVCTPTVLAGYALGYSKEGVGFCLYGGEGGVDFTRIGPSRLLVRPEHGFIDLAREPFWNSDRSMRVGEKIELGWVSVTVTQVSKAGEPLEAIFQFARSLDDPKMHLRYWSPREGRYLSTRAPGVWGRMRIEKGEIVLFDDR